MKRPNPALREAFIGMLVTVGPFFGVRYQPPRVEIPVVMSPAPEDLDPATAPGPAHIAVAAGGSTDGDTHSKRR